MNSTVAEVSKSLHPVALDEIPTDTHTVVVSLTAVVQGGVARAVVNVPLGTTQLDATVALGDSFASLSLYQEAAGPSACSLRVVQSEPNAIYASGAAGAGRAWRVTVQRSCGPGSERPQGPLFWAVMGRGAILSGGLVRSGASLDLVPCDPVCLSSWPVLEIPLSQAMAPAASVVVWTFVTLYGAEGGDSGRGTGSAAPSRELLVARQDISLPAADALGVPVSVVFNTSAPAVVPGEAVQVVITAAPHSRVYIGLVDVSVLTLAGSSAHAAEGVMGALGRTPLPEVLGPDFACYRCTLGAADLLSRSGLAVLLPPDVAVPAGQVSEYPDVMFMRDGPQVIEDGAENEAMPMPATAESQRESPGAEAAAGSAGSGSPRVRSFFPETWAWDSVSVGADGTAVFDAGVAPDTITSWAATAFAVGTGGLGLADAARVKPLRVFQPFFVQPALPASAVRGEVLELVVGVFAFPEAGGPPVAGEGADMAGEEGADHDIVDLIVVVTLNDADFWVQEEEVGVVQDYHVTRGGGRVTLSRRLTGRLAQPTAVTFAVQPTGLGPLTISVAARATALVWKMQSRSDAVEVPLLVEPEGVSQERTENLLVELSRDRDASHTFALTAAKTLPNKALLVPGSLRARVSVTGDLMGPTVQGLGDLLAMPYGCGEQVRQGRHARCTGVKTRQAALCAAGSAGRGRCMLPALTLALVHSLCR
jgi:hypothetical protein